MSIARLLLRPAAKLAGLHAAGQLRRFQQACLAGRQAQDKVLAELIARSRPTRFGRDHHLASVHTYDDFRRAVPVGDYDSLAPYLRDVYEGDTEALFAAGERILLFALTSGTTGEPKRIPITAAALAHYRRGWNAFGYKVLTDHPRGWLRKILQISSSAVESSSPTGIPCGSISGLLATTQKRIVRRMYVAGPDVMAISDPEAKYYTLLRMAICQDVGMISTANPSSIIKLLTTGSEHAERLCRDVRDGTLTPPGEISPQLRRRLRFGKRAGVARRIEEGLAQDGELRAAHVWNLAVMTHWTGGTLGLYLPQLRRLAGDVPIRDIGLLASEGRMSLPLTDETPAGAADILGAFLEFIPADDPDAPPLRSHELDIGGEYFIVLTNFSGLWRYNIYDRIRVTDYLGDTPIFAFLAKAAHTTSLTGEKLTEHQIVDAMDHAARQLGRPIERFLAQPCFDSPPYYRITLEADGFDTDSLVEHLDNHLRQLNIEYDSKRHTGRLGPVRIVSTAPGTFAQRERDLIANRGGRGEQYKHQYLLTDVDTDPS